MENVPSPPDTGFNKCLGTVLFIECWIERNFQVVDSWCKELTVRWTVLTYLLVLDENRRCGTLGPTALSNNPCQSDISSSFLHLNKKKYKIE